MKKLLVPFMALALLGAGCFGGVRTDNGGVTGENGGDGQAAGSGLIPLGDLPVDGGSLILTDDMDETQSLAIEIGFLLVQAAQVGVDATEIDAWNNEARLASEALENEDYEEANRQFRALKAEIEAEIAAAQ